MFKIRDEAKKDLASFENSVANKILDKIENYLGDEFKNEKVKVIRRPSYNAVFHRLKLVENELNHRVYFDYQNSEIQVFAVRHRDHAYTSEDMQKSIERLRKLQKE